MMDVLQAIPKSVVVAAYVSEREALWVYNEADETGHRSKESIILRPFVDAELLTIVQIDSEDEAEAFANFAAEIRDQGEAITGAIALCRHWAIVTDDRKARRLFQRDASHLQLVYTLELVKHWVDVCNPMAEMVTATLRNIRHRSAYTPHKQHPLYDWWHRHDGG
jgi:predicted nucleic acid-binding protein